MRAPSLSLHWGFTLGVFLLACQPDIGDSCTNNSECSLTNDRLCDPTSPNGYCTIFNCQPGKCPDEAACVGFYTKLSNECTNVVTDQRFERSFCMKKCSTSDDCRVSDGYDCLSPSGDAHAVNAVVLEYGDLAGTKVCMVRIQTKGTSSQNQSTSPPAICSAPDAAPSPSAPEAGSDAGAEAAPPKHDAGDGSADGRAVRDATVDAATRDARIDR
jgi:hypothetical protein